VFLRKSLLLQPRDKATAEYLWFSLPPDYRQRAVCFTDFYAVYACVLPSKRHKAVGDKTAYIERFNNTLRQRCARLVRKALSFSKSSLIILGLFGTLFTITMHAFLLALTQPLPLEAT
jgi:insertion element IS1 protein InsB